MTGRKAEGAAPLANQDSFIEEVNEEVRRDRLYALLRRYGWIAVLLIVILVGGAAWNEWRKASDRAEAEALGNAVVAALETAGPEARRQALAGIETGEDRGAEALVALLLAGADRETGAGAEARAGLERLAGDADLAPLYRDLAALKAVLLSGGELSAEDRISRLQGLALPGAPYRLLALEQIALAEVARGDVEAALGRLREIAADGQVTPGQRRRTAQLMVALGGAPGAI